MREGGRGGERVSESEKEGKGKRRRVRSRQTAVTVRKGRKVAGEEWRLGDGIVQSATS